MIRFLVPSLLTLALTTAFAAADEAKPAEAPAAAEKKEEAPKAEGDAEAETKLVLGVVPGTMQYDKKTFTVKAGSKVAILFTNKACPLQHNLIILKPGTDAAYGAAADKLIVSDPAAALAKHYLPDDETSKAAVVVATTKLIGTGQNEVIKFTAPNEPGDYPYVCTFPGHRFLMKGVMKVEK